MNNINLRMSIYKPEYQTEELKNKILEELRLSNLIKIRFIKEIEELEILYHNLDITEIDDLSYLDYSNSLKIAHDVKLELNAGKYDGLLVINNLKQVFTCFNKLKEKLKKNKSLNS